MLGDIVEPLENQDLQSTQQEVRPKSRVSSGHLLYAKIRFEIQYNTMSKSYSAKKMSGDQRLLVYFFET